MATIPNKKNISHPVVNGGNYVHKVTGEDGLIMGTIVDENSGKRIGCMYTFKRGPLPAHVTENSESMLQWELITFGSKAAATQLVNAHLKEHKE